MDPRTRKIIQTLLVSLATALLVGAAKLLYGKASQSLAFIADGIHSFFDAAATLMGIISVKLSSKPPDEGHPYGHHKFETVSALALGVLLLAAAYEVGSMAIDRLSAPRYPIFSFWGVVLLVSIMTLNFSIARLESKRAKRLSSNFLAADSIHNQSDVLITCAVLVSLAAGYFRLEYVDSVVSIAITLYLVWISYRLISANLLPLVDHRVLDPRKVEEIVTATDGVLHCHHIRSRGQKGHHFLDLNIHVPGHITLERAHHITHDVEARLKNAFPGLVDVVIHTEPHGHEPCSKEGK